MDTPASSHSSISDVAEAVSTMSVAPGVIGYIPGGEQSTAPAATAATTDSVRATSGTPGVSPVSYTPAASVAPPTEIAPVLVVGLLALLLVGVAMYER